MDKLEVLKQRLENQIEASMDTIIEIEKLEQSQPWRKLSNWHQIWASMIFYHILTRSVWDKFEWMNLTLEQRIKYIEETAKVTNEHLKELYGFDTKMDINK